MSLRKKYCLKLPAIFADDMDNVAIGACHDGGRNLAAAAHTEYGENGYDILAIDLFEEDGTLAGRYFADPVTCEHKGWNASTKEWYQKIRLDNLTADLIGFPKEYTHWGWRNDHYSLREGDETLIHNFLGMYLSAWENAAESNLMFRRAARHEEIIRQKVDKFWNEDNSAFEAWAGELVKTKVVICQKSEDKTTTCTCSCCGESWKRKGFYRSSAAIACPKCGEMVKPVRESSAMAYHRTDANVYQVAQSKDGKTWYIAMWHARGHFMIEKGEWTTDVTPYIMAHLEPKEHWGKLYYWRYPGWSDKKNGSSYLFQKGTLYPDLRGAENCMDEDQTRRLRAIAAVNLRCNIDRAIVMREKPVLEYIIKGGFTKLAGEMIDGYWSWTEEEKEAKTANEFFGFDRQRQNRLRQLNGGGLVMKWLRWEARTGKKIADEDLQYFVGYSVSPGGGFCWGNDGWHEMLERFGSPRKVRNYVEKQRKLSGETAAQVANDYADYIDMAKKMRLNLKHSSFYKPVDLKLIHDDCVRVLHTMELEIKAEGLAEKFPEVNGILKSIAEKYTYKGEEFQIIVPSGIIDILREGKALGHCVDTSDRYFERIEQRTTYLVFLRRNENPEQPYYTLEIQPSGTVRQQRTTGNVKNEEDVEAYKPFILEWQKEVRKRLTAEDKELDQKSDEIRVEEYQDLRDRKELIHSGILAGTLLVDALEGDLIMSTAG